MVDTLTWLVLVPMLRSNPDPAKVAWAEKMFFNFYSYNTVRPALSLATHNMLERYLCSLYSCVD